MERNKTVADSPATEPAPLGAGVRSLVRGHHGTEATLPPAAAPEPSPASSPTPAPAAPVAPARPSIALHHLPKWYFLGADLLLSALALIVVAKSARPLHWFTALFCVLVVALGASLALWAVYGADTQESKPTPPSS